MNRIYLFFLLLICLPTYSLRSQHIGLLKGQVLDSLSQQPLAYAHVKIKDKAIGVPTNSEGKFSLPITKQMRDDTLIVSLMGYISTKVAVNELLAKDFYTFLLKQNTFVLEEVMVETKNVESIIKEVGRRLKDTFPSKPYEFEGCYRNAYQEFDTYIKGVEVAFNGFDGNFHQRSGHSVTTLKKKESPDFRKFRWRQAQGNLPWHSLWRFRRQYHYFFTNKQYRDYDCSLEDITYLEGEKVYKLNFVLKDKSKKITTSWAFIRVRDYAILEIGGKTDMVNPEKFHLADTLFMAYTGGSVQVKFADFKGKMYPSYSNTQYLHQVYNGQLLRQGNFTMNEELIIHQINTEGIHKTKNSFEQSQSQISAGLPVDTLFWKQYTKPVETLLSRKIEHDLAWQSKALAITDKTQANYYIPHADSIAVTSIAVDKLREDFTLFQNSLEQAHPSLYRYTSKQKLDSLFLSTYQSLTSPLSEIDFYRLLTPIIAQIRCGHTGSLPSKKYEDNYTAKKLFLPIQTTYTGGKLYVVNIYDTQKTIPAGNEILSINGQPVEAIIQQILPHLTTDGFSFTSKNKQLAKNFVKLYSLYIAHADTFEILSRNKKGYTDTLYIPAISYQTYLAWNTSGKKENTLSFPDAQTALLKVTSFTDTDTAPFKDWTEDIFDQLRKRKVKNLIIDLRGNEGGRDDYGMYLLSFLVKSPFTYQLSLQAATNHYSFLSHTNQHSSFNTVMEQIVKKDADGNFMLSKTHPTLQLTLPSAKNLFTGKLFFLIDGETFSAAADFAALARELKLGVFIGEETAGAAEGNTSNGEILLTLPNSAIRVGIPLFRITNAISFSHATGRGVIPDYQTEYTIDDYLNVVDKDLEFVKTLILKSYK
ncbi:S41 family peptidase [Cytophagaceae bacterium DM2B3-1]|uniref:S41 family peptidase n=1 Tax=Xanthocytophaga flava TaxID=3048013 RepID=A0ABT7CY50_9BACT|nr:S41 family peptidase [Xanthocytophaga flavus]MDJ1498426.1 S41 family peptidase [Xanthocytophaga flavus]